MDIMLAGFKRALEEGISVAKELTKALQKIADRKCARCGGTGRHSCHSDDSRVVCVGCSGRGY